MYTPDSTISLQKHDTPERFFKQMDKYGLGAAIRIKKHPDSFKLHYILPSIGAIFFIIHFAYGIGYLDSALGKKK